MNGKVASTNTFLNHIGVCALVAAVTRWRRASACSLNFRRNKAIPHARLGEQVARSGSVELQFLAQTVDIKGQLHCPAPEFESPNTLKQPAQVEHIPALCYPV